MSEYSHPLLDLLAKDTRYQVEAYEFVRNALSFAHDELGLGQVDAAMEAEGEIPDAGAVIGALEGCSKRKVELVVGKPSPHIVEVALEQLGRLAGECLMIGDRVETDILMGHRAGMATALVLTGVTRREDLPHSPVQPDYVLESIAELPRLFKRS